jgi:RimJ/RimL family protein N-acetyltransferase
MQKPHLSQGFWDHGKRRVSDSTTTLVGLIDVLRNYRIKFEWWIGLMLVVPASRNAGLGSQIQGAFERYAFKCGA